MARRIWKAVGLLVLVTALVVSARYGVHLRHDHDQPAKSTVGSGPALPPNLEPLAPLPQPTGESDEPLQCNTQLSVVAISNLEGVVKQYAMFPSAQDAKTSLANLKALVGHSVTSGFYTQVERQWSNAGEATRLATDAHPTECIMLNQDGLIQHLLVTMAVISSSGTDSRSDDLPYDVSIVKTGDTYLVAAIGFMTIGDDGGEMT